MVLLVIDAQPEAFPAATRPILAAIVRHVRRARRDGVWIAIVEHGQCAGYPTHPAIRRALAGYPRAVNVVKPGDDGANPIFTALYAAGCRDYSEFRLCGVNADKCVLETAHSLAAMFPDSRIAAHRDACATVESRFTWDHWDSYAQWLPNIRSA